MENTNNYININNLGFDFLNPAIKEILFYYPIKHNEYHEFIFFYNKTKKTIGVNYEEYYKIGNISFKQFIKPFNFEYNWIKDFT